MNLDEQLAAGALRPQLKLLNETQLKDIHEAALQILDQTGMTIHLPEAVELLREHGARVEGEDRVRIPPAMVEKALKDVGPIGGCNILIGPDIQVQGLHEGLDGIGCP